VNEQMNNEFDSTSDDYESLCQMGKIGAVGAMAAGIAHDFKNLLSPILLIISQLQRDIEVLSPEQSRRINLALACVERAQDRVQSILDFVRCAPSKRTVLDPRDLLTGMKDIFALALNPGVVFDLHAYPHLPSIEADRNQLEAALLNLVINSRDAMPRGGRITVTAKEDLFSQPGTTERRTSRMLRISVCDNGDGMSESTLRHAARPFYSTKMQGGGTGLGLATVRATIKRYGGHLSIHSSLGHGTAVDIWLPVAASVDQFDDAA
jgi:signal transduction histidine kinase